MTKQELPKEYLQWIKDEKKISSDLYLKYMDEKASGRGRASAPAQDRKQPLIIKANPFFRIAAAAVLVLALGFSIWIKKDDIFKPNYTEEQIDLAYQHAVKSLAVCANSLNAEMGKLQKITEISKSLDNIKTLETVINN